MEVSVRYTLWVEMEIQCKFRAVRYGACNGCSYVFGCQYIKSWNMVARPDDTYRERAGRAGRISRILSSKIAVNTIQGCKVCV